GLCHVLKCMVTVLFVLALSQGPLYGQNGETLSGHVVTKEGLPVRQATVSVKGTINVVKTDAEGRFVLQGVSKGSVLLVSYVGKLSREVVVDKSTDYLRVILEEDVSGIEEVI